VKVFPFPIAKNWFQPGVEKQLALSVHLNGSGPFISEKESSYSCRIGVMLVVPYFFLVVWCLCCCKICHSFSI
jgi:hypothetical protein